jgi:hypothetical protein
MPCVMAPAGDLELLAGVYPERMERMVALELELRGQFHPRYSITRFMGTLDAAKRAEPADAAV